MNVNPNTSRHEDKPLRHHLLSTEYDEKISTAGQAADQPPVLLHPDSVPGRLETLQQRLLKSSQQFTSSSMKKQRQPWIRPPWCSLTWTERGTWRSPRNSSLSKVKYTDRKWLQASLQENNRNVYMLFNEVLIRLSSLSLLTMII